MAYNSYYNDSWEKHQPQKARVRAWITCSCGKWVYVDRKMRFCGDCGVELPSETDTAQHDRKPAPQGPAAVTGNSAQLTDLTAMLIMLHAMLPKEQAEQCAVKFPNIDQVISPPVPAAPTMATLLDDRAKKAKAVKGAQARLEQSHKAAVQKEEDLAKAKGRLSEAREDLARLIKEEASAEDCLQKARAAIPAECVEPTSQELLHQAEQKAAKLQRNLDNVQAQLDEVQLQEVKRRSRSRQKDRDAAGDQARQKAATAAKSGKDDKAAKVAAAKARGRSG